MCQVSHVRCHLSHGGASRWRVCYQRGLPSLLDKISDTPFDQRSLFHREAWFPQCFIRQNQQQKKTFFCAAIFDNFQTKNFKSETTSFHYFSPILDIQLQEVGAKRRLKGTSKVKRRTHGQINLQKASALGRCFENAHRVSHKGAFQKNAALSLTSSETGLTPPPDFWIFWDTFPKIKTFGSFGRIFAS